MFPQELKLEYISIIEKVLNNNKLTNREFSMLLYFERNYNKREFAFVPKKYKKIWQTKKPFKKESKN